MTRNTFMHYLATVYWYVSILTITDTLGHTCQKVKADRCISKMAVLEIPISCFNRFARAYKIINYNKMSEAFFIV